MPEIVDYPPADSFTGAEFFALDQAGITKRGTIAQLGAAAGSHLTTLGQFYADRGAYVGRQADRFFIGSAADNPAFFNRDATPTDWLTGIMVGQPNGAWAMSSAQGASLARYGNIGFVAGSRTSDARFYSQLLARIPPSIGLASFVANDDANVPTTTVAWALYAEATRTSGVNIRPTVGFQCQAVNFGQPALPGNPYAPSLGGGTYGVQIGSGAGHTTGTSDASAAVTVMANPTPFQRGLVFGAAALSGTDGTAGSGGYATAIQLGRNQSIEWWAPDGGIACYYRSVVTAAASGSRVEHNNNGVGFYNSSGQIIFGISTYPAVYASLIAQPGSVQNQAAGIYVAQGAGSPDLGLFPASGGELAITSPITGSGTAVPATVGWWLHMKVNGVDFRVPLFTAAQVGS